MVPENVAFQRVRGLESQGRMVGTGEDRARRIGMKDRPLRDRLVEEAADEGPASKVSLEAFRDDRMSTLQKLDSSLVRQVDDVLAVLARAVDPGTPLLHGD